MPRPFKSCSVDHVTSVHRQFPYRVLSGTRLDVGMAAADLDQCNRQAMVCFLRDTLGIKVTGEEEEEENKRRCGDDTPRENNPSAIHGPESTTLYRRFVRRKMAVRNQTGKISLSDPLLVHFERQLQTDRMHSKKRRRDVVNHASKFQMYLQSTGDDRPNLIEMTLIRDTAKVNLFFEGRMRVLQRGGRRTLSKDICLWLDYIRIHTTACNNPDICTHLARLITSIQRWKSRGTLTYTADGPSTIDHHLPCISDQTAKDYYSSSENDSDHDAAEFLKAYPLSATAPVPRMEICRKFSIAHGKQTKEQIARAMQVRCIYSQHKLQAEKWANKYTKKPSMLRMSEERRSRRWKPTVHAMELMWKG